jgi:hypothetical protein
MRLLQYETQFSKHQLYSGSYPVLTTSSLDLGRITPENIYLNKTAFNSLIRVEPNFSLQMIGSDNTYYGACSWSRGCASLNTTWAQALTGTNDPYHNISLPIILPSPVPPSVIDITYLCPIYVRKSLGNLLVSVFAGMQSVHL